MLLLVEERWGWGWLVKVGDIHVNTSSSGCGHQRRAIVKLLIKEKIHSFLWCKDINNITLYGWHISVLIFTLKHMSDLRFLICKWLLHIASYKAPAWLLMRNHMAFNFQCLHVYKGNSGMCFCTCIESLQFVFVRFFFFSLLKWQNNSSRIAGITVIWLKIKLGFVKSNKERNLL